MIGNVSFELPLKRKQPAPREVDALDTISEGQQQLND
jgi:hypothetical protein